MIKRVFYIVLMTICPVVAHADYDIQLSDTNFAFNHRDSLSKRNITYNYNRFRTELDYHSRDDTLSCKFIGDLETYLGDTFIDGQSFKSLVDADPNLPFNPYLNLIEEDFLYSRFYAYRLYVEHKTGSSDTSVGLQRVPFGVGRLWNPSDTFNPVDALSLESDERQGVFALNHVQHLSDFNSLQLLTSFEKKMELDKYGARYKGHHLGADMALSFVKDSKFYMFGAEFESNLYDTGVELRSELSFFDNSDLNKSYLAALVGAEYAFAKNTTVLLEYFYNGLGAKNKESYNSALLINGNWNYSRHYLGSSISYQSTALTALGLNTIVNILDGSLYIAPSIIHSLSDESTVVLGANIFCGNGNAEFDRYENLYYLKLETYF